MGRVDGKVAIVTGGGLGIGHAAARLLAREGAAVVVTDIKETEGQAVVREIEESGGKALFLDQDVSDEARWDEVIAATIDRFGRLDVLVNNAGVGVEGNIETAEAEQWRWLMGINLDGVFFGTRAAVRAMKETGGGSIINLSSIEGIVGDPALAAYNASKGGVRLLTKSAALYCGKAGYNIRVNSVHPGYIWTPMVENYLRSKGSVEDGRKALVQMHPIGRLGDVDDIAYGILYLASDESKFMTGSELVIDGGYTAQ